jgi:hypothetical protein
MSTSWTSAHTRLLGELRPLLAEQFGVASRAQLRSAGVSDTTIARWVAEGLLHRNHPGVYAVGHATLTREARWLAGQLACAPHGRVTHWTAAIVLNLASPFDHRPHITLPPTKGVRRDGIRPHRSVIPERDQLDRGPWRTTTWARAIVDCADIASRLQIEELLTAAHDQQLYDHHTLETAISDAGGRHGLKRLIPTMEAIGDRPKLYRSRTERRIAAQLTNLGLPEPEVNATLRRPDGRYVELDLFFRDAGVNVEIDGPHHELPAQKAHDAERDGWLQTQRIVVRRFPVKGLRAERVAREVRRLL